MLIKETNYYKETHEDNNYKTASRCNELYRVCADVRKLNGYTLEDLYKAIAVVKLRNDYILNFFAL